MRQLRRRILFSILRNFVRKFDAKTSNILRKIIIDYAIYAKLIIYKSTADILDFTSVSSICKLNFAEGITYPSALQSICEQPLFIWICEVLLMKLTQI